MIQRLPRWIIAVAIVVGAAWAIWLGAQHLSARATILDRAETALLDLRILLFGPLEPPIEIAIVAIDDETIAAFGGFPLDRSKLAELVRAIVAAGAKTLAIDFLLVDSRDESADLALANALAAIPSVIASAAKFADADSGQSPVPTTSQRVLPLPVFAAVAAVGLVNIATDAGGTPRHMPLAFQTDTGLEPSFVLRAAGLFLDAPASLSPETVRILDIEQPLDVGWHLPIRYYGPAGSIPTFSAGDVLAGSLDGPALQGKLVVLGATGTGVGDRFGTPFDPVLPGVEILATCIANLLDSTGLVRDSTVRRIDVSAAIAVTIAGLLALSVLPLTQGLTLVFCLLVGCEIAITIFFGQGIWLSGALPLAASLPPLAGLLLVRQSYDRHLAKLQAIARNELGRFHSPALAKRIGEDPSFLREPMETVAAILFVDLSGFTGASERLGPARTRELLKGFHTMIVEIAGKHGGVVLDFMGDGAMVCFGIPEPLEEDSDNALLAAFELVEQVGIGISREGDWTGISGVRIGVHQGDVVLSRLGHDTQQQIAATGDCVNVASRLMDVAKASGSAIVASAALADRVRADLPSPDTIETIQVRGRQQSLDVVHWRTVGLPAI
jgi:adenylate cyclase